MVEHRLTRRRKTAAAVAAVFVTVPTAGCAGPTRAPAATGAGWHGQPTASSMRPGAEEMAAARDASSARGTPVSPLAATATTSPPAPSAAAVAPPVRIRIPALGVDAPLDRLGLAADGSLEAPARPERAGWYGDGPEPGEPGPAVVAGHVDWYEGPAVFFRLRDLRPGDHVLVDRADGSSATFVVDRVERHPKSRFPTEAVYRPTPEPVLRLVTCGGPFDRSAGHYRDNLVVFARLG